MFFASPGVGVSRPPWKLTTETRSAPLRASSSAAVPPKQVDAFQEEMRKAGVDWQFVSYGGAVHAFTNPGAGSDNSKGAAYNERADRRSWEAMKTFFAETLK